jgi:2-oxo-4-hydroxy-4-carboxy--5-ureidoimidazoline (OHCU) decarboxylase
VRDVPRQLTAHQLADLFEGRTQLVDKLAERDDPLGSAHEVILALSEEEKLEALNAHPAIGARNLSARSAAEQGTDDDPETLAELDRLNGEYEERFGFRFVVFVNRRPKSKIVQILRERLRRSREEELDTAVHELVAIAEDRWRRS